MDDDEARRQRLAVASTVPGRMLVVSSVFVRNSDVIAEVLLRAKGACERCGRTIRLRWVPR
jgi:5-methylcytosine-specific restriction protein A